MNKLLLENKKLISEGLRFHLIENISIHNNIYRPGSTKYFDLFREVRDLHEMGLYELNEDEKYYINQTDIGEWGLYEGELVPLDYPMVYDDCLTEAEYRGRKVTLNKPKRGGNKKFYVYVKDPKTKKIKKISFGAKGMTTGLNDPKRVKSFVARHRCKTHAKDKTKAAYWSCRLPRYIGNSGKKWW